MIDFNEEYYQYYYNKLLGLVDDFCNYNWSQLSVMHVKLVQQDPKDKMTYQFLKMATKDYKDTVRTYNNNLDEFLKDPNVLAVGKIKLGPYTDVGIHIDPSYWTRDFFRSHIPMNTNGAKFIYGNEKILWTEKEVRMYDVTTVEHGGENQNDSESNVIFIDIAKEGVGENGLDSSAYLDQVNTYVTEFEWVGREDGK